MKDKILKFIEEHNVLILWGLSFICLIIYEFVSIETFVYFSIVTTLSLLLPLLFLQLCIVIYKVVN